jgi:hypothetical protein
VGRPPTGEEPWSSGVWTRVDCMKVIFILKEIWMQGKNIYFDRNSSWLKYCIYRLVTVLASNYKQHILRPAEVRKVRSSLP